MNGPSVIGLLAPHLFQKRVPIMAITPVGWMVQKVRDDPESGERFLFLTFTKKTASRPIESWDGAHVELSPDEARHKATQHGVKPLTFTDALERARTAFKTP
jgi:hypothetical protein